MKLKKKHWQILKFYLEGWIGELHSYVKGHREESLSTLLPLSVEDHRQVDGNGHAKNWPDTQSVPINIKYKCTEFWEDLLSDEDFQVFVDDGLAWI